ncbi:MAG: esterase-like activity of phytase family protein [Acidobacteriota bacterium]
MRRFLPAFIATILTCGCGGSRGPVTFFDKPIPLLVWLGEFTRPAGTIYPQLGEGAKFGSVSGLAPDPITEQWVGVIDERAHSRIAWMNVTYGPKGLEVNPTRIVELRAGPGVPDRIATQADLEAIVALPDGRFIMSEEGHLDPNTHEVFQPALLESTHDGVVTGVIAFPKEFQITGDGKTGLHDNQGFEGLTMTPSGRLIAGLEQPLIQDGMTTFERPAPGRLIEFVRSGSTYKPGHQWRYMISPTPVIENFEQTCHDGENGLVELLALSETTLISMERACLTTKDHQFTANAVQLFSVELINGDARKTLLLNFDDVAPRLSSALTRLENFEGLTFGPIVNGEKTLLIVSDDNFTKTQKTAFLLFGMR